MLNFVLCDDNINILNKMAKMLETLFIKNNYDAKVSFCSDNPNEILEYTQKNETNVLILDINLKFEMSGIELAKKVREKNKSAYIIFTTGHLEYAMLAYKVKTFDYLAKPVTIERLEETLFRLFSDAYETRNKYIKLNSKTIINQDDILYIKRDGMKLIFHTKNKQYEAYNSFNKLKDCLSDNFVRCHKSYLVNINKINRVELGSNMIVFDNINSCYIGPKYKNKFLEVFYGNYTNDME